LFRDTTDSMTKTIIISLGGSIVAPNKPDKEFLKEFRDTFFSIIESDSSKKFVFIVGGGGPARQYQKIYRKICGCGAEQDQQDWIGIAATRLNAELIRGIFVPYCKDAVVTNPYEAEKISGRVLVAAGWKPGFSTDNDAVILAEKFNSDTVINLSNISQIYTEDPKINPNAEAIDQISWEDFKKMVGDTWEPGKNVPFDPVATQKAAEMHCTVITAAGKNLENTRALLEGRNFIGTVIGPD